MGEGPRAARIALVGEQPGDEEDRQGRPFVGPAGKLLINALNNAGIERSDVYVTNAVKHFKFGERWKRRLHKKSRVSEMNACRPWPEAELSLLKPEVIIRLGATASLALLAGISPDQRKRKVPGTFLSPVCNRYNSPSAYGPRTLTSVTGSILTWWTI